METKLRAWDKKESKMITNIAVWSVWEKWTSWLVLLLDSVDDKISEIIQDEGRFEVMQYIWKKDTTWKKIFVWDLVKYEDSKRYWEIYFDDYYSSFRMRYADDRWDFIDYAVYWLEFTIKGNIKETPELLNN